MASSKQSRLIVRRFQMLLRKPFFWLLTFLGQIVIWIGALGLYFFEAEVSEPPASFLDALLWSTGIVTTVGYGNFVAQTTVGKWMVLGLLLMGTLFVWTYMGFVVTALIAPELSAIEKDVHEVEKELHELQKAQAQAPTPAKAPTKRI
ncbi:MAG: potassium channel family protein [Bdellovibrio sp.]